MYTKSIFIQKNFKKLSVLPKYTPKILFFVSVLASRQEKPTRHDKKCGFTHGFKLRTAIAMWL